MKIILFTKLTNYSSTKILPELVTSHDIKAIFIELKKQKSLFMRLKWLIRYDGYYHMFKRLISFPFRKILNLFFSSYISDKMPDQNSIIMIGKKFGIPIFYYKNINSGVVKQNILRLDPEVGIICGTGIIKKKIFNLFRHGCINFHSGILPQYRGLDTIFWTLYNKDYDNLGFTIHFIDDSIDTGSIIFQSKIEYNEKYSVDDYYKECCVKAAPIFLQVINELEKGRLDSKEQSKHIKSKFYWMATYKQKKKLNKRLLKNNV